MPTTRFEPFSSPYVVLPAENVDTDQIIPARFLKTTERSGLGKHAFHDWRYLPDESPNPQFILNKPEAKGARVLVAGRNFGCGSSREHAVWALQSAGFQAVISADFADIFRGNALGNGLLPIQVPADVVARLIDARASAPDTAPPNVSIDLASGSLVLPDGDVASFPIAPFARHCLLNGIDEMDFLLGATADVDAYELARSFAVSTISTAEDVI
jgi:3-isopropylmalate/(R)-2-methylmalate dehydratase small subunit